MILLVQFVIVQLVVQHVLFISLCLLPASMINEFILCPVSAHGNWGNWGAFGACNDTCDGFKTRSRSCDDPIPSNGGDQCILTGGGGARGANETETQSCNPCVGRKKLRKLCHIFHHFCHNFRQFSQISVIVIRPDIINCDHIQDFLPPRICRPFQATILLLHMAHINDCISVKEVNITTYKFDTSSFQTWATAKASCEALGGHLAVITTKKENDWITNRMNAR